MKIYTVKRVEEKNDDTPLCTWWIDKDHRACGAEALMRDPFTQEKYCLYHFDMLRGHARDRVVRIR
jgi:hypothetical protein